MENKGLIHVLGPDAVWYLLQYFDTVQLGKLAHISTEFAVGCRSVRAKREPIKVQLVFSAKGCAIGHDDAYINHHKTAITILKHATIVEFRYTPILPRKVYVTRNVLVLEILRTREDKVFKVILHKLRERGWNTILANMMHIPVRFQNMKTVAVISR